MEINSILGLEPSWERLKRSREPVCVYGTGNACERILDFFAEKEIKCAGIFASDGFVRQREFRGFPVLSLSEAEERFGDFTACIAFGSDLPEVMAVMRSLTKRHTVIMPDLPIAGDELFTAEGLSARLDRANAVCERLADNHSRSVMEAVLSFKLTGNITLLDPVFSDPTADFAELIDPKPTDSFADLGAYTGDTVQRFLSCSGGHGHIYAFEPDKRTFRKLTKNLLPLDNVTLVNACSWDCDGFVRFSQAGGRQSMVDDKGQLTAARRLDSVVGDKPCTVIKYDVEGAEKRALSGSSEVIRRCEPRLVISAYHRPYDLIDLPEQVLSLNSGYSLYLRQPAYYPAWDTTLFCTLRKF